MRTFIYFSSTARTTGNFDNSKLMEAGRMDIVCHTIVNAFFLSHKKREDVVLHLVFYGSPDPPKHIILQPEKALPETGKQVGSLDLSKKDVSNFIKKMLYKYREGKKTEVFNGCFIEKKNLFDVIKEIKKEGKKIFILDEDGENIRKLDKVELENAVFLLGDHRGLPLKELKRLKQECELVSVGNKTYFASQTLTIVNNELDVRGI